MNWNGDTWFFEIPPVWELSMSEPRFFRDAEYQADELGNPGAEEEWANYWHVRFFWEEYGEKISLLKTPGDIARANAKIAAKVALYTRTLTGTTERSFAYQLSRINKAALYRFMENEYDSLNEFLNTELSEVLQRIENGELSKTNGEVSNLNYLITVLFPRMQAQGIKIENWLSIAGNYSKLRGIVAALRRQDLFLQMEIEAATPEQKEEATAAATQKYVDEAKRLLDLVADPKVVPAALKNAIRNHSPIPKIEGNVFFLPGETVYLVRAPNKLYAGMVEDGLKHVVSEWNITDAKNLAKLMTNSKQKRERDG